ncbi:MAG: hypothetical protein ABS52_02345 [Gemmatimonadetes bacterium SCN 70-22]|nr:MAG: hypothetical protein ABS52_02345 [Gemmatimonadetes bacterium SCN 70-22]
MHVFRLVLAATAMSLAACGGSDDGGTTNPPSVGGFTLALSQNTLSVTQGGTATVTANITRTGSFAGTVELSTENLPAGVTASFTPAAITSGTNSTTLTITAAAGVAAGSYNFTIRGKATGLADQTANVAMTVTAAPKIALALAPAAGSVVQGNSTAIATTVTRTNFTGAVTLAVTGQPTGVTTTVATNGDAGTITVNAAANAAVGTSTLTVTASGTGVANATATYALTITAAPTGSFTVAVAPAALTVQAGANGQATVTVTRTDFTGAVALAVTGAPNGVTTALGQSTLNNPDTATPLTIGVGGAVAAGNYPLTITATSGGATQTATLTLTVTAAPAGSIALALSATSATVNQGASTQFTVNITRTNFAGNVTIQLAGLPAGVTPTITTSPTAGNAVTVQLAVGAATVPGSYGITVTGSGTGIANATTQFTLNVAQAPVGSGNVTWTFGFCDASEIPLWVAAQNGSGVWQQVVGTNNAYSFNITSAGGIAYVTKGISNEYEINFYFGSLAELQSQGTAICPTATTKTVNGSVANLGTGAQAQVSLGSAFAQVMSPATTFTLSGVEAGTVDLVAARQAIDFANPMAGYATNKLIIRRNLNPANGSTLPVLDFGAAEAFDPVSRTVTINGSAAGDQLFASSTYFTANQGFAVLGTTLASGTTGTYYGVPSAQQVASDLHVLVAASSNAGGGGTVTSSRIVTSVFKDAVDKSVTLGAALNTPTFTTLASAPYLRSRVQLARQAEYNQFWAIGYGQTGHAVSVVYSAAYLGANAVDFSFPDFSGVSGWQNSWAPVSGSEITWNASASGWTLGTGGFTNPYSDGAVVLTAARTGSFTP